MVWERRDLHDWKEAQQALHMTQAGACPGFPTDNHGRTAASIAHEVNQPLTAGNQ